MKDRILTLMAACQEIKAALPKGWQEVIDMMAFPLAILFVIVTLRFFLWLISRWAV